MATKRTPSGVFALPTLLATDIRLGRSGANVTVRGEVDVHTAPLLRDRLNEVLEQGEEHVIVYLDAVTFMDSTGLGVLVAAHRALTARGAELVLVCSEPRLLRIFELTGTHEVLTIDSPGGISR